MNIDRVNAADYVKTSYSVTRKVNERETSNRVSPGDDLAVSNDAVMFAKILSAAKSRLEESNTARLAAVKNQINAGAYLVDAGLIAESMLMKFPS